MAAHTTTITQNDRTTLYFATGLWTAVETTLDTAYEIIPSRVSDGGGRRDDELLETQQSILGALRQQNVLLRQIRDGLSIQTGVDLVLASQPDQDER